MRCILLSFSILLFCSISYSQKVFNGVGPYFSFTEYKKVTRVFFGFTYSFRLNVYEKENFSVSLGVPLAAGFSLRDFPIGGAGYTSQNAGFGNYYSLSIPLIANLNWGAGSSKSLSKKTGYFVGGGLGYFFDGASIYDHSGEIIRSLATSVNGGIRIATGKRKKKNIEFKLHLINPFQKMDVPHVGFSTIINF